MKFMFTLKLERVWPRILVFTHDLTMIAVAWFGAYWLKFNMGLIPSLILHQAILVFPLVILVQAISAMSLGLYRGVWRFASIPDLIRIAKSVVVGVALISLSLFFVTRLQAIPRSIFPIYSLLLVFLWGGPRFVYRALKDGRNITNSGEQVLIVGAGNAGETLARELLKNARGHYVPVGFVDDDAPIKGQDIHGIRVLGRCSDIPRLIKQYNIQLTIIAIPSADSAQMRRIVDYCEETGVPFRTLPRLSDLASGRVTVNTLRDVSLLDLLGRDPVHVEWAAIKKTIAERCVLVSGGGGSIGSELTRQICELTPSSLIIIDNCEYNLYALELEIQKTFPYIQAQYYLADVTDAPAMAHIFQRHRPEIVFHAAAYKHVPLLESQVRTAVRTNLIGTQIMATQAQIIGSKTFVFISTDKAVNPTNVMGASKRAAEIFCQNLNTNSLAEQFTHHLTSFITVRFGNVLGSTGSVIPLFRQQIQAGGPVTVTHPDIERYFMTIKEASHLILQASTMGEGGEIFVLDMGEPIKITYLAEQMIRLSGKEPYKDIEISYVGLRPGEKLKEELFHQREQLLKTSHGKIRKGRYREVSWTELMNRIKKIIDACDVCDEQRLIELLHQMVPEYGQRHVTPEEAGVTIPEN